MCIVWTMSMYAYCSHIIVSLRLLAPERIPISCAHNFYTLCACGFCTSIYKCGKHNGFTYFFYVIHNFFFFCVDKDGIVRVCTCKSEWNGAFTLYLDGNRIGNKIQKNSIHWTGVWNIITSIFTIYGLSNSGILEICVQMLKKRRAIRMTSEPNNERVKKACTHTRSIMCSTSKLEGSMISVCICLCICIYIFRGNDRRRNIQGYLRSRL